MIIRARHHKILYPFFRLYTLYIVRKNFSRVMISGEYTKRELPVLLISNHISWWDGFWAEHLNEKILKKGFYFMMLEDQLKKYSFFANTGGYSIKKGTRSALESINYTIELLSDKRNLVLLFPQGSIASLYQHSIIFERGIEKIISELKGKINIVFTVNLPEYFSGKKPSLFIYFKEYELVDSSIEKIQVDYNIFYHESLAQNLIRSVS